MKVRVSPKPDPLAFQRLQKNLAEGRRKGRKSQEKRGKLVAQRQHMVSSILALPINIALAVLKLARLWP